MLEVNNIGSNDVRKDSFFSVPLLKHLFVSARDLGGLAFLESHNLAGEGGWTLVEVELLTKIVLEVTLDENIHRDVRFFKLLLELGPLVDYSHLESIIHFNWTERAGDHSGFVINIVPQTLIMRFRSFNLQEYAVLLPLAKDVRENDAVHSPPRKIGTQGDGVCDGCTVIRKVFLLRTFASRSRQKFRLNRVF